MDLTWKKHEPQASPFAIVAGNPTEYVVYSLSVTSADDEEVRAAIDESVAQMCRLAAANVTQRTEMVLFEWDSVYSTLTVVYTDRERSFDAGEVLKVFVEAWEADTHELSEDEKYKLRLLGSQTGLRLDPSQLLPATRKAKLDMLEDLMNKGGLAPDPEWLLMVLEEIPGPALPLVYAYLRYAGDEPPWSDSAEAVLGRIDASELS